MKKVSAVIGLSFFHRCTLGTRGKARKTYDHLTFGVEELDEHADKGMWEVEDPMDEETLEVLAADDDDASL